MNPILDRLYDVIYDLHIYLRKDLREGEKTRCENLLIDLNAALEDYADSQT